jgi:hypothetical protein
MVMDEGKSSPSEPTFPGPVVEARAKLKAPEGAKGGPSAWGEIGVRGGKLPGPFPVGGKGGSSPGFLYWKTGSTGKLNITAMEMVEKDGKHEVRAFKRGSNEYKQQVFRKTTKRAK